MNTINFLDDILIQAIRHRTSDIHFQPERNNFTISFRIDGTLYEIEKLTKQFQDELISRIKVLSEVDFAESRVPQEGHFELNYEGKIYNIRLATLPTLYGEALVMRILNRDDLLMKLEDLGFDQGQLDAINQLINSPYGMILITGPCGSGKTVLLYSILSALKKPGKNIITLEDPIECQIAGIRQIQINEKVGLSFSRAMRTALRQDPDIVMLGEIRDAETAQMAVQAALTGILFFSTFHTLDVPAVVSRLMEIGVPASLVAQTILGVVSARLVRKICDACREPYELTDYEKKLLADRITDQKFSRGRGCVVCKNSGYFGRTGVFEITRFDEEVKSCIIEKKSFSALAQLLQNKRAKTLQSAAIEKVLSGITTVEEMVRVTGMPR